ncbi:MAG: DUF2695 domain-containing protein [Nocardioides sp.]|nr:DUF2695 domain-containing protein [Nocardioidaceae bacterium]MCB8954927.1 DUF2695 domain-containing protein [Nocardioides sp.]
MAEMTVADAAELYLRAVVEVEPQTGECLVCFVDRMVAEHGCDGSLLWSVRFRDLRSPTATALEKRFRGQAVRCDCMVLQKAYTPVREVLVRDVHTDELERPERMPPCAGVRRTNTRPCAHWRRSPMAGYPD